MNEFIPEQILERVAPAVHEFNLSLVRISPSLCLSCFNVTFVSEFLGSDLLKNEIPTRLTTLRYFQRIQRLL